MSEDTQPGAKPAGPDGRRRRLIFILAPIAFAALAAVLAVQLLTGDPRTIPSALIDKPAPEFDLAPVQGYDAGLSSDALKNGEVVLVNIFASWCGPCLVEHPFLMDLAEKGTVKIYGINYKDAPDNASAWLKRYGDPYTAIGADLDGRVGIDWGVYGVPETFIVDGEGRIRYKHIGVLSEDALNQTVLPLVAELSK